MDPDARVGRRMGATATNADHEVGLSAGGGKLGVLELGVRFDARVGGQTTIAVDARAGGERAEIAEANAEAIDGETIRGQTAEACTAGPDRAYAGSSTDAFGGRARLAAKHDVDADVRVDARARRVDVGVPSSVVGALGDADTDAEAVVAVATSDPATGGVPVSVRERDVGLRVSGCDCICIRDCACA